MGYCRMTDGGGYQCKLATTAGFAGLFNGGFVQKLFFSLAGKLRRRTGENKR
jgi:hypothetical protein